MDVTTYTNARANLKTLMDKVNDDRAPITITRNGGEPVVMISLADYMALDETAYLTASPANKKALDEAFAQMERGEGLTMTMQELEAMINEDSHSAS